MKLVALGLPLFVLLAACTENDEELVIRPDGSVSARMSSKGKAVDLADGYLLPLDGAWQPDSDATRAWLALVGPDTGSPASRAALAALPDGAPIFSGERDAELAVRAELPSVAALPQTLAPRTDPYWDAFLRRSTSLAVRREGGRTVYVFERRYAARDTERYAWGTHIDLPDEIEAQIVQDEPLRPAVRAALAEAGAQAFAQGCAAFAEDAVAAIALRGAADLGAAERERALASVAAAIARQAGVAQVRAVIDAAFPAGMSADGSSEEIAAFERGLRDALRAAIADALEAESLPPASRKVALFELERLFTAVDHTADLGDDALRLSVTLPGRIVLAPGAKEVDGGRVRWEVSGADLSREVVLRAVSVEG